MHFQFLQYITQLIELDFTFPAGKQAVILWFKMGNDPLLP
jgi:hypothetical protein